MTDITTANSHVESEFTHDGEQWRDLKGVKVWRAGTLVYYKKDLIRLFFWLFLGQFTFWMQAIAIPMLFPLLCKIKGFSAGEIGTLWSMMPLVATFLVPVLGVMSDHTRSRFGRRRPYDLFTTPFWFLGLLWLPFTNSYWEAMVAMSLVAFAGAGSSVLTAFYNDVVPPELMGRFSAGKQFLSSTGALICQWGVMRIFESYPELIFVAIATIGFVGEMLMLFFVKEGTYPAPPPNQNIIKLAFSFTKDGFANRYIIYLWLTMGVTAFGGPVMGTYFSLYFTDKLGYTTGQLGMLMGIGTVIGLCLIIPAGWVVDSWGPKRLWSWCGALVGLVQIAMYFLAKDLFSITILFSLYAAINTMLTASLMPVLYSFIPKDKFGQLNGSNSIVSNVLSIIAMSSIGWVITLTANPVTGEENYSVLFLFGGAAYLLTPVFMWLMLKQPYPYGDLKPSMNPDGNRASRKQTSIMDKA